MAVFLAGRRLELAPSAFRSLAGLLGAVGQRAGPAALVHRGKKLRSDAGLREALAAGGPLVAVRVLKRRVVRRARNSSVRNSLRAVRRDVRRGIQRDIQGHTRRDIQRNAQRNTHHNEHQNAHQNAHHSAHQHARRNANEANGDPVRAFLDREIRAALRRALSQQEH